MVWAPFFWGDAHGLPVQKSEGLDIWYYTFGWHRQILNHIENFRSIYSSGLTVQPVEFPIKSKMGIGLNISHWVPKMAPSKGWTKIQLTCADIRKIRHLILHNSEWYWKLPFHLLVRFDRPAGTISNQIKGLDWTEYFSSGIQKWPCQKRLNPKFNSPMRSGRDETN